MVWQPNRLLTTSPLSGITSVIGYAGIGGIANHLGGYIVNLEDNDQPQYRNRKPSQTKTQMKYPTKKRVSKGKVSTAVKQYVKKASLMKTEIKNYNLVVSNAAVVHATQYAHAMTQGIVQGTTNEDRVGDEIFINAIRFNILVASNATAGAYSYRLMLVWSGEEFNNAGTLASTSLASSEVFLPGFDNGAKFLGVVNRKAVTVLWDRVVDINSNIANTSDCITVSGTIGMKNQRFPYQAAGSIYGKTKNLYFVAIPNVVNGVTGTTGCGAITITYSIDFRDP